MNWRFARRVAGYCVAGILAAAGVLGIHAFAGERTWVDRAEWRYRQSQYESEIAPRRFYRDCGWRILACNEVPTFSGPLASIADSLFEGVNALTCVPGMGWEAWDRRHSHEIFCMDSVPSSHLWFGTDLRGVLKKVTHRRGPDSLKVEFGRLRGERTAQLGPPTLCMPEKKNSRATYLQWQVGPIEFTLEHTDWDGLAETWEVGRIYCLRYRLDDR